MDHIFHIIYSSKHTKLDRLKKVEYSTFFVTLLLIAYFHFSLVSLFLIMRMEGAQIQKEMHYGSPKNDAKNIWNTSLTKLTNGTQSIIQRNFSSINTESAF